MELLGLRVIVSEAVKRGTLHAIQSPPERKAFASDEDYERAYVDWQWSMQAWTVTNIDVPETTAHMRQAESPTIEALFDPGGRVSFQKIVPVDDRPPLGCIGCRRVLTGAFDTEGFFVETARPDGSGSGGMVVCASCMAEAVRPRRVIDAAPLNQVDRAEPDDRKGPA